MFLSSFYHKKNSQKLSKHLSKGFEKSECIRMNIKQKVKVKIQQI